MIGDFSKRGVEPFYQWHNNYGETLTMDNTHHPWMKRDNFIDRPVKFHTPLLTLTCKLNVESQILTHSAESSLWLGAGWMGGAA